MIFSSFPWFSQSSSVPQNKYGAFHTLVPKPIFIVFEIQIHNNKVKKKTCRPCVSFRFFCLFILSCLSILYPYPVIQSVSLSSNSLYLSILSFTVSLTLTLYPFSNSDSILTALLKPQASVKADQNTHCCTMLRKVS